MSIEASRTSVYLGSPLEAAQDAARKLYDFPEGTRDMTDGEVMELRAKPILYGPSAIHSAEELAIAPYRQEVESGIRQIEETLAREALRWIKPRDQGE